MVDKGTGKPIEDEELADLQEKIEETQKTVKKPEHPCPYCEQELPLDYVFDAQKKDLTLSLSDANIFGKAKAKEDFWRNKLDLVREDMNEYLQEAAAKYDYFNAVPGIDWDDGVLTGVDANGAVVKTEIKVTKVEITQAQKHFKELQQTASKARRAVAEKNLLLNDLAQKYGWNRFPCDIRNNKFVDITDEVLKQQNVRLEQVEQQLRQPKLKDDKGECCK